MPAIPVIKTLFMMIVSLFKNKKGSNGNSHTHPGGVFGLLGYGGLLGCLGYLGYSGLLGQLGYSGLLKAESQPNKFNKLIKLIS